MIRRNGRSRFGAVLVALTLLGIVHASPGAQDRARLKVLFIGNSYTFVNNLPDILVGIAAAKKDGPTIEVQLQTASGATLKQWFDMTTVAKDLRAGAWTHVVLQEQSLLGGREADGKVTLGTPDAFHGAVRRWVPAIRDAGAKPVLFMTWARDVDPVQAADMQSGLTSAYQQIGTELSVPVSPVGLAWSEARKTLPAVPLHDADRSHPSPAGSYLSALVLYATITGLNPIGAPPVIDGRPAMRVNDSPQHVADTTKTTRLVTVSPEIAASLQRIAWKVASQR